MSERKGEDLPPGLDERIKGYAPWRFAGRRTIRLVQRTEFLTKCPGLHPQSLGGEAQGFATQDRILDPVYEVLYLRESASATYGASAAGLLGSPPDTVLED